MGLIEIDGPKALALLAEAVEAKGADYVYPRADYDGCTYTRDDAPSCLVGHALHRAGLSIDVLKEIDSAYWGDDDADPNISNVCNYSAELFGFSVDDAAYAALQAAQRNQDNDVPWGEALVAAQQAVESRTR